MARYRKNKFWLRRIVFVLVALVLAGGGAYYFLADSQDLVLTDIQIYRSERENGTITHSFKISARNFYYYHVDVYLALPNIWHYQGVAFSKDMSELHLAPFEEKEMTVTFEVPADLIEGTEMKIDLVKSIEREQKEPIIKSLYVSVSALAD